MSDTATATQTFEVGRDYHCRSFADHECVWTFSVVKRTAKFVTLREDHLGGGHKDRRVGVRVWDGVEVCSPLGTYSLSPVLSADRTC